MKKIFVLDTNVLLSDPRCIFKFSDNDVVIPLAVIEQIDHFKREQNEIARSARQVSRLLDSLCSRGILSEGISIFPDRHDSARLYVNLGRQSERLPRQLERNVANHILATSLALQTEKSGEARVIIISNDSNLRVKANAFGIEGQELVAGRIDHTDLFGGITAIDASPQMINSFYDQHRLSLADRQFYPNEFVILRDEQHKQAACGIFRIASQQIEMIVPRQSGVWGIHPRNIEQSCALEALLDDNIKLVTLSGAAGTGKTLLAIAAGLNKTTDEDVYSKMLVARPVFPLGRDLGFLPGDLDEKLNPWMQPIYDNLEFLMGTGHYTEGAKPRPSRNQPKSSGYQELIEQGLLAVEPITYIRGRSIPRQYFVVDEAQNLSQHEIKTIVTRAGEGTKIVLSGDPAQIDNPWLDAETNGLTSVIERFKNTPLAAHVTLSRGERSKLATLAAKLLQA